MQIIGIICEYNPFHNGHLYHLKKIKERHSDSLIILVLNGYFLQRGEISIITKEDKTKIALANDIDLVIELPYVFGTQSADTFASISITILENLKCEYVVFGSESNNLDMLEKISDYTKKESKEYQEKVQKNLNNGYNYPASLAKALNVEFAFLPNDLLGISYLKAIKQNYFQIKPELVKRSNNYHDTISDEKIVSASNIRDKLSKGLDITKYVPNCSKKYIKNISLDKLFAYLKYKIITEKDLSLYLDVNEGIDYRLKKVITKCHSFDELMENIKSRRYTYNKIKRMFIHILIGLTKEDCQNIQLDYIKVLGFNNKGKEYLHKIKKEMAIPIAINKNSLLYKYELLSAAVYDLLTGENTYKYELSCKPIARK